MLGEAGLTLLGENRAQELEAKADRAPGVPLALHRPAAVAQGQAILPYVELIHSVASESALAQLGAPRRRRTREILLEVNVAGEEGKAGIDPSELAALPRARPRSASRG